MKHPTTLTLLSLMTANLLAADQTPALIPVPQKIEVQAGAYKLQPGTQILTDAAARRTGEYLAKRLGRASGYKLKVRASGKAEAGKGAVLLTTKDARTSLGPEGYELTVDPESVVVRASAPAGLFYGAQTLLQLLPPQAFAAKPVAGVDWQIPCVRIEDQPRFKWRGLLLDVARHFFTKEEVEQVLDLAAALKINTLQMHLTDDQGWRVEIR